MSPTLQWLSTVAVLYREDGRQTSYFSYFTVHGEQLTANITSTSSLDAP